MGEARRSAVQINWENTINQIFGDVLTCPRCAQDGDVVVRATHDLQADGEAG